MNISQTMKGGVGTVVVSIKSKKNPDCPETSTTDEKSPDSPETDSTDATEDRSE